MPEPINLINRQKNIYIHTYIHIVSYFIKKKYIVASFDLKYAFLISFISIRYWVRSDYYENAITS